MADLTRIATELLRKSRETQFANATVKGYNEVMAEVAIPDTFKLKRLNPLSHRPNIWNVF